MPRSKLWASSRSWARISLGLTFQEKAFYDILIAMRDKHNFVFGEDTKTGDMVVNDKCKLLAKKIKELIDMQSSFTDWLNNDNVKADLNKKLFFLLLSNGYPPQYNNDVFNEVLDQVENFKQNHPMTNEVYKPARTIERWPHALGGALQL